MGLMLCCVGTQYVGGRWDWAQTSNERVVTHYRDERDSVGMILWDGTQVLDMVSYKM